MPKPMNVLVHHTVVIDAKEVDRIFHERLEDLTEGRWVQDGKIYVEQYTTHRFDVEIGSADDPRFAVSVAACELQRLLKEKKQ